MPGDRPILPLIYAEGTALYFAAMNGQDDAVRWLSDHGASLTASSKSLCQCDHRAVVTTTRTSRSSWYPLHIAMCYGNLSTVRLLVDHGAPIDTCFLEWGNGDMTMLHMAVARGHHELLDLLMKKGTVKVNHGDENYSTPLNYACMHLRNSISIHKLVRYGGKIYDPSSIHDALANPPESHGLRYVVVNGSFETAVALLKEIYIPT
ncbi:ankyrin repeat-containing domain protein [Cladorrhinum sp. PSN332]|nr:ankyrin repeat-containing domain protein [Cladorrhinum sp. PSN332]